MTATMRMMIPFPLLLLGRHERYRGCSERIILANICVYAITARLNSLRLANRFLSPDNFGVVGVAPKPNLIGMPAHVFDQMTQAL